MRRSYIRKESYEMHEEKGWNSYPSFHDDQYHYHHSISSPDIFHKMLGKPSSHYETSDHLHDDHLINGDHNIHHDDEHHCLCGTHQVKKTTSNTILKKRDQLPTWRPNTILRPPLGWTGPKSSHHQPHQHVKTTYYDDGDGYDHEPTHGSYHRLPVVSNGGRYMEKNHELESLLKEYGVDPGLIRSPGVKVIEVIKYENTRTHGAGFGPYNQQWKVSKA